MIIGQKSFAFGHDGDLIEIDLSNANKSSGHDSNNDSNTIKNLETSAELTNSETAHYDITEKRKIVTKGLSLEENVEYDNSDTEPSIKTHKGNSNAENVNFDKNANCEEDVSLNVTSYNLNDIRRASSGSCDTTTVKTSSAIQRRRYSDGFVHTTKNSNETNLLRKRRTLKRQTRISDADTTNYCDSEVCISDTMHCKESECNLHTKDDTCEHSENIRTESMQNINENPVMKYSSCTLSDEANNCAQPDSSNSIKKEQQYDNDCCIKKNQSVHSEEETTCCCHSGTKKYWMEKIIQKNKNLENMVVKSRREMKEIREMLNNVLSVRLEPGF